MKSKNFILDAPVMFLVGLLVILLAGHVDRRVQVVSYQKESTGLTSYSGDIIEDSGTSINEEKQESAFYNGSDLEDNGLTFAIKVNKKQNVVTVYRLGEDGYYSKPCKAMVCSVGETGNTPEGVFNLGERSEWLPLEGGVYGQYCTGITDDILFHSVPYFTQNKNDLEIEEYNKLGQSVSAGCVRLSVIDAAWIYNNCSEGTMVEIYESDYEGPMGKPVAAVIGSRGSEGNWDPTDPDRDNPYVGNIPMILGANDREVERFADFNVLAGVSAIDSTGVDVTNYIEVDGEVDTTTCGTYKVTYSIVDETGLKGTAVANIIVKDKEPPELYVDQKVESIGMYDVSTMKELHKLLLSNVVAYDGSVEMEKESILVDYSEIVEKGYGKCHVKYQAKDSAGNVSDVAVLTIDVDLEAPKLSLSNAKLKPIRESSMLKDDYLLELVEASDNSGEVKVTLSRPLSYIKGQPYSVVYCAKDAFGNVSTLSVTYQLED